MSTDQFLLTTDIMIKAIRVDLKAGKRSKVKTTVLQFIPEAPNRACTSHSNLLFCRIRIF